MTKLADQQVVESAVQFAAQTGRLDLLTAVLAVLALLLGLAAVPVFYAIRRRAEDVAREAVEDALKDAADRVEAAAASKLEQMLPILIEEYMKLAQNAAGADQSNQIAAAQENDGTR